MDLNQLQESFDKFEFDPTQHTPEQLATINQAFQGGVLKNFKNVGQYESVRKSAQSNIAAGIAALKGRQSVAYAASVNLAAAAIKVNSVDFAKETGFLTKNNILLKSALAMLSQANKANSSILVVLK